jgi:hypothetical protein
MLAVAVLVASQKGAAPEMLHAHIAAALQAGQYTFNVTPPSTLPGLTVLGSPLAVAVTAGPADASHCSASVYAPANPVVGSVITANVTLADAFGNPVTGGQSDNSKLVIYGMFGSS